MWEQVVTDTKPSNMVTFTHCPKKLWTVIGQANQDNAIAFHSSAAADGRKVGNYLVEILTGDTV